MIIITLFFLSFLKVSLRKISKTSNNDFWSDRINLVETGKSCWSIPHILNQRKPILYYKIVIQQISSWKICGKHQLYVTYMEDHSWPCESADSGWPYRLQDPSLHGLVHYHGCIFYLLLNHLLIERKGICKIVRICKNSFKSI